MLVPAAAGPLSQRRPDPEIHLVQSDHVGRLQLQPPAKPLPPAPIPNAVEDVEVDNVAHALVGWLRLLLRPQNTGRRARGRGRLRLGAVGCATAACVEPGGRPLLPLLLPDCCRHLLLPGGAAALFAPAPHHVQIRQQPQPQDGHHGGAGAPPREYPPAGGHS